jgi:IS605 OrfB family transposase
VKNDGNPFKYKHYNIGNLLDSHNEEKKRIISNVLEEILQYGEENNFYKVTIENLDNLQFKKTYNKDLNRMLSKFPKTIFEELITSKCARKGIKIKKIHPAYTSIIGLFKYSYRDNLDITHSSKSKDLSAALVVGRRGLGIVEKPIISIRVFNKLHSFNINSLLDESEKDSSKKTDNQNAIYNHLWKKLKQKFSSVKALTEHVYNNLYLISDNKLTLPNNSLSPIVSKPF